MCERERERERDRERERERERLDNLLANFFYKKDIKENIY